MVGVSEGGGSVITDSPQVVTDSGQIAATQTDHSVQVGQIPR